MSFYYSQDRNVLNVVALLKAHGIKKVVASPGGTDGCLIASLQHDGGFEMYSCVDERSAAYMAVGLAAESREPVVIICTEATASRNYMPGITEAYHRKLPILAITCMHGYRYVGNLEPQVIDRSVSPTDTFRLKVNLPVIKNEEDVEDSAFLMNRAILELGRHGGGPVHVNMPWPGGDYDFTAKELPSVRVINRYYPDGEFPKLPEGKVAIYCGVHVRWDERLVKVVDRFCAEHDAVVFGYGVNGYWGKYKVLSPLLAASIYKEELFSGIRVLIHMGEEPDDYTTIHTLTKYVGQVWRVSPDGELRDLFGKLTNVFEMEEHCFFKKYIGSTEAAEDGSGDSYYSRCRECLETVMNSLPEFPFSNIYAASSLEGRIPGGSVLHLGMSNTLRAWSLFEAPSSVTISANLGCRGIDGSLSALIGASQAHKDKLYFGTVGDLTFFYDMNSLGNRHLGANVRILLINNGGGNLFRNTDYCQNTLGLESVNQYIAAAGHFGDKSPVLVKNYAESLGFEYLCAKNKNEFEKASARFLAKEIGGKPILFEIFTEDASEIEAFRMVSSMGDGSIKKMAKKILGPQGKKVVKSILGK